MKRLGLQEEYEPYVGTEPITGYNSGIVWTRLGTASRSETKPPTAGNKKIVTLSCMSLLKSTTWSHRPIY